MNQINALPGSDQPSGEPPLRPNRPPLQAAAHPEVPLPPHHRSSRAEPTAAAVPAPLATAADGDSAPQGPPAPGDESITGGAGGENIKADGEAEAVGSGSASLTLTSMPLLTPAPSTPRPLPLPAPLPLPCHP
jgi:hypothetical protein